MTEQEVKKLLITKPIIVYIPKNTRYKVLGLGKTKLENGDWSEGLSYMGEDGVVYTRAFNMFDKFKKD